jgi:hypothetical protein
MQAIWDAEIETTPSLAEGQTNFPRSNRLYTSARIRRSPIKHRRPTPPISPQHAIGCATPTSSADRMLLILRLKAQQLPRLQLPLDERSVAGHFSFISVRTVT